MPPTIIQNKKIHIAKKQLGLSDEVYRDILHLNFKVESSKQLSIFQAEKLLEIFKAKGWKAKQARDTRLSPRYEDRQHRKIVAMWITLSKAGAVKSGADRALQAYVKRMTGIDNLRWCGGSDCRILIEGLKSWGSRMDVEFD